MVKGLVVAGVSALLLAGCGSSGGSPAQTDAPTPIVFDDDATVACQSAESGAWSTAHIAAKTSSVKELQDVALREEQTGSRDLVKAWCAQNFHRR